MPNIKELPKEVITPDFTQDVMKVISHSLGVDYFKAVISKKQNDKKLPKEFYRNYYQADKNTDLDALCEWDFAIKEKRRDLNYYFITESGIEKYRKQFNESIVYTPTKLQDLKWLKKQINLYCSLYNYNFCPDNSEHIIEYYLKYWLDGNYVSHTTKDVINQFKSELKRFVKP